MDIVQVKDLRQHLCAILSRVMDGEQVFINRKGDIYALIHIGKEEAALTPQLQERIEEARKNYKEGKCTTCHTKEELDAYFNSL